MKLLKMLGVMVMAVGLTGCNASKYYQETNKVDATAAFQLLDREQFEALDLSQLVIATAKATFPGAEDPICKKIILKNDSIEQAFSYFKCVTDKVSATKDGEIKVRNARNSIQERILAASTQRCNAFEANLQRSSSRHNFYSGFLSTAAGTVGALVTGLDGARVLSGISGIASGYRAEYNQDYMSNLAAYVIIEGIDKRRRDVYGQIQTRGQASSMAAYPLEAAVKDALFYHGQCSVIVGFQEASDAIKYVADPGLDASIRTLSKIKLAAQINNDQDKSSADVMKELEEINKKFPTSPRNMAGSLLGNEVKKEWTLTQARKDVEDGYLRISKKKDEYEGQWGNWRATLGNDAKIAEFIVNDSISGYGAMTETYKNALDKISEIYTKELAGDINCTDFSLNDDCSEAFRLADMEKIIVETFTMLVNNKLAASLKSFDNIPPAAGQPRTDAINNFSAVLQTPLDFEKITIVTEKVENILNPASE